MPISRSNTVTIYFFNMIPSPFSGPLYVMAKPAGALCNLACDYCYYLEKSDLYSDCNRDRHIMSDELLERYIKQYIQSQTSRDVMFTWHGGEALLRPISFYKKAIELQKIYGVGYNIDNSIQTNGILINDEWCKFFRANNFLVGVSLDGPAHMHNRYRKTKGGFNSFNKVMRGVELMKKHGVQWNAMAAINDYNSQYPVEFYRFFKEIGSQFIQFTPVVERITSGKLASLASNGEIELAPFSVTPKQWGKFMCAIFDEWLKGDVGKYYIQLFDSTLANWVGQPPGVCSLAKRCGHATVMEFNGDVYSCDHFVFDEYKLGNIFSRSLLDMAYSTQQAEFGDAKELSLPKQCQECNYKFACNGECPKNRFAFTKDGEGGLNYLCEGYYQFFNHAAPYMDFMKRELLMQRPPANVMKFKPNTNL